MHLLLDDEVMPQIVQFRGPEPGIAPALLADESCGPALRVYLALTDGRLGGDLAPEDRFYNRYFWFLRFVNAHHSVFGEDAGIDQQAFQILDSAEFDVDWALLEQLNEKARGPNLETT